MIVLYNWLLSDQKKLKMQWKVGVILRQAHKDLGKISALCKSKSYLSPAHKPNKLRGKNLGHIGWDPQTHRWLTANLNGVAMFEEPALNVFLTPCKFTVC